MSLLRSIDRRYAFVAAGLVISALFLWLAVRKVDVDELARTLSSANRWALVPFAVALLGFFWLKAERWRLLIRSEHAPQTRRLVEPMMIGFAANNVLPFRAGELLRVLTASRVLRISRTELLASVVVERILDAFSVAVLTGAALVAVGLGQSGAADQAGLLTAASIAVLISGASLLFVFGVVGKDLAPWARFAPVRYRRFVASILEKFAAGLEPVSKRTLAISALLLSIAQWGLLAVCVSLSLRAVGVASYSLPIAMIVLGLIVLGISVPSAPAFVGATEYAFVMGLGFFGVAPSSALAAAIFYHATLFVAVTSAGAVCWFRYAMRRRGNPQVHATDEP